ncbi:MAG: hypothetical protein AB8I08_20305 [Sandaracinaceae bacterium]
MNEDEIMRELLGDGVTLAPEVVTEEFQPVRAAPRDAPELAVTMQVPRTWEQARPAGSGPVGYDQPLSHGVWRDTVERSAPMAFELATSLVPREISAEHLAIHYAREAEMKIRAMDASSRSRVDAILEINVRRQPFVQRLTLVLDGDRARFVTATAHAADARHYAPTWATVLTTLRAESPLKRGTVEEWRQHTLGEVLSLDTPRSWRARTTPGSTETNFGLEFFQKDYGGRFTGFMSLDVDTAVQHRPEQDELQRVGGQIGYREIELYQDIEHLNIDEGDGRLRRKGIFIYRGEDALGYPIEAFFARLELDGHPVRLWSLGVSREVSTLIWGQNQAGFRGVLDTLEPTARGL